MSAKDLSEACRSDADFAQYVAMCHYGYTRDDGVQVAPYHLACKVQFYEGATCVLRHGHIGKCAP